MVATTTCNPLDPLCGSWFKPISREAVWVTVVAWVVGSLLMVFQSKLIWHWEGGLRFGKNLSVPLEKMQIVAYLNFWIVVLVGWFLTKYTELDVTNTPLTRVFGYNNVCVNFDFPPSNYALPYLWAITLVSLMVYQAVRYARLREDCDSGRLGPCLYQILDKAQLFTAFSFIFFSTVFAVTPALENEDPEHITLMLHTAPFSVLQIGVTLLGVDIAIHHVAIDYWSLLGLPARIGKISMIAYVVAMAVVTTFKIIVSWNAMLKQIWFDQTWIVDKRIAQAFDHAFLFLAAIVPPVYGAYLIAARYDELPKISLKWACTDSYAVRGGRAHLPEN